MIETERLLLRPPLPADFEESAAMFGDPDVTAHIGGQPLARAEAWTRFLRDVGHWSIKRFGLFSIVERASGRYVGKIGHAHFERDLGTRAAAEVEMSWTLASGFHGRGYATEAGLAAQAWFDKHIGLRTACSIASANHASLRLAARLGYAEVDQHPRENGSLIILARDPVRP
ncbi:RimJ/RimL family protein N-acetyltransferase [Novosphingobium sp. PhB165]|uniref:GNAT family N-acetyltransferase n=1 Tax=Novosphingobium sp. PhB165 TaxID=2485105 RepID=UPI0010478406|nr:GNAT family N-acetyltransferase [Novosphingobium sp. PhB165]TCM15736.1 RimJ/RimL family protein N-acetyltransferase [Novosphingobium sp. PhB165]